MKKLLLSISLLTFSFFSNAQIINTIAGTGFAGYSGNGGQATACELDYSTGVALTKTGLLYIADDPNHTVRMIDISSGIITTIAGTHLGGFSGDGGQASAADLYYPTGVAVDSSGNIYIADAGNNRVRFVNHSTGIILTIAGDGAASYGGDGGQATAAELNNPTGVTPDNAGNIYIADEYNNRIRKVILSTGIISTVAGSSVQGYGGDGGQATLAKMFNPNGTALDGLGNLYIADTYNDRVRIVNLTSGSINTYAGDGNYGMAGDGGPATAAELWAPWEVTMDASHNLYITDNNNNKIREVTFSSGIINTLAGNGTGGFSGDGGPAIAAELNFPQGTAIDGFGNLYFADMANNRIRKISGIPTGIAKSMGENFISIYPNPAFDFIYIETKNISLPVTLEINDITGRLMLEKTIELKEQSQMNISSLTSGIYFVTLKTKTQEFTAKVLKE